MQPQINLFPFQGDACFFENSEARNSYYSNLPDIVNDYMTKVNSITGKNIKPFDNGKPLCSYILNTLNKCDGIDEKYVYCSDESIKEYIPEGIKYLKEKGVPEDFIQKLPLLGISGISNDMRDVVTKAEEGNERAISRKKKKKALQGNILGLTHGQSQW